jgi:cytochrome c oxidase subunit 3
MAGHASKNIDAATLWGGKVSPFSVSYGKLMMWFFLVSDALTFGGLLIAYGFFRHSTVEYWPTGEEVFNSLPFLGHGYPLIYVALMTFILIISSVTMVLAVEAGHRMDKRGVVKWMAATIIGGFIFLGSQAWEWSHFIHGSEFGKIQLNDGSFARTEGHDGHLTKLIVTKDGGEFAKGHVIEGEEAHHMYQEIATAHPNRIVKGANLSENEYGPQQFSQLFFFITGFHGFHVFSGVMINIIIFLGVMKGTYHRRGHYEMVEKTGLYWHFVDLVWVFVFTFFYLV